MTPIPVKECKNYDPLLAVLCVVLTISTLGFAFLAVKNSSPLQCDNYKIVSNNKFECIKVVDR